MPYRQIYELPSRILFLVFPPVTMKVSLLLLKTSLSSCSGSYTLSPPPGLDYSVSMQTRFCFPSTKNKKQLPSLPHPLAATSFPFHSKPCLHLLSTYLVTSPSLLLLFHLIFCPYCFSEAVLISQGLQWPPCCQIQWIFFICIELSLSALPSG